MKIRCTLAISLALVLGAPVTAARDMSDLESTAERTAFRATGRYDEMARLCHAYASHWPRRLRCFAFGTSPEGRTLWALAASNDGTLTADKARTRQRPVILAQGGIHAGEIDGKDAGFLFLRELMTEADRGAVLDAVTFVFVPIFSVDGHERFGAWNRPNQVGPEEMGWRTTAQNLNLNRDYMKAEAPEMQAMLRLLNEWDPLVYVDLHVTDGADFQHDISITTEPLAGADEALVALAKEMRDSVIAHLAASGSLPLDYYPSFVIEDDPASGFAVKPSTPRYSDAYWALHNRVGMLVETHSWKDYRTRVMATLETLRGLLAAAGERAGAWQAVERAVDERVARLDGATVPLAFDNTNDVRMVEFRGYAYEQAPSEISGSLMTRYDATRKQTWTVPMRDGVRVTMAPPAPRGGYLIPPITAQWLLPKLQLHGIRTLPAADIDPASIAAFRAGSVTLATESFEGRVLTTVSGAWSPEPVALPEGTVFVPIAQPLARLAMALLEPDAPDSLASWGFFPTAWEIKEYMEPYVAEQVAREMLARDADLAAQFQRRLAEDPAFAGDPAARLDYFYRRHPSWDTRYGLYPVLRVE